MSVGAAPRGKDGVAGLGLVVFGRAARANVGARGLQTVESRRVGGRSGLEAGEFTVLGGVQVGKESFIQNVDLP